MIMNIKKILFYVWMFFSSWLIIIVMINFYVLSFSQKGYYKNSQDLPVELVWLVFWASVKTNGEPSDILKDRLKWAFQAYNAGKIQKIIVSGDNSTLKYNEPYSMQQYLISLGVKKGDIYLDYAGFDTYDSLYRAKEIFGVERITLFTQDFHLKRAMYIAKRLWIYTLGSETNLQKYIKEDYNNRREIFARIKAFLEVEILKNKPRYLGDKIDIITDDQIEQAKKELLN